MDDQGIGGRIIGCINCSARWIEQFNLRWVRIPAKTEKCRVQYCDIEHDITEPIQNHCTCGKKKDPYHEHREPKRVDCVALAKARDAS